MKVECSAHMGNVHIQFLSDEEDLLVSAIWGPDSADDIWKGLRAKTVEARLQQEDVEEFSDRGETVRPGRAFGGNSEESSDG